MLTNKWRTISKLDIVIRRKIMNTILVLEKNKMKETMAEKIHREQQWPRRKLCLHEVPSFTLIDIWKC